MKYPKPIIFPRRVFFLLGLGYFFTFFLLIAVVLLVRQIDKRHALEGATNMKKKTENK
jgi:hypothetical protein